VPKDGTLRLAIRPWGEIYVDGALKGVSPPMTRLALPEGTYQIEVRNPGGPSYTRQIEVRSGQSVEVGHRF
jgi:serine/threonine-protein kinase